MTAGRRPLTREVYDMLLIAYRESPGNASYAARRALCGRQLAKRLWDGRPYRDYPWARAISAVLEDEKIQVLSHARELAQREALAKEAERTKATQEAIESQAQERQMLRVARGDVLGALVLAASLVPAMNLAAKAITEALKAGPNGEPPAISPAAAMQLLSRHAQLVQRGVGAAEAIIQLSRLERGASTANLAVSHVDLTLEQALEELEGLGEVTAAARAEPRRLTGRAT